MIFKKDKNEDYLGVSRKRLFDQGTFSEGLKNLESATLESTSEPSVDLQLQSEELQQHIGTQQNLEFQPQSEPVRDLPDSNFDEFRESRMADRLILSLEDQVAFLKGQLEVKDHQLQTKDELIRNFQVLIKQDQDTILMLENKLSETRTPDKITPLQEDSDKIEKENAPQQAEVRYNRESKQKTTTQGVVKAKRSFLAGWFEK